MGISVWICGGEALGSIDGFSGWRNDNDEYQKDDVLPAPAAFAMRLIDKLLHDPGIVSVP